MMGKDGYMFEDVWSLQGFSSMMFNTGDLCRWKSDGSLAHEGRADDQVKIKGFRVELDSVSASIEVGLYVTSKTLWN
jgi:non-ribosomal peptide synthetase component F